MATNSPGWYIWSPITDPRGDSAETVNVGGAGKRRAISDTPTDWREVEGASSEGSSFLPIGDWRPPYRFRAFVFSYRATRIPKKSHHATSSGTLLSFGDRFQEGPINKRATYRRGRSRRAWVGRNAQTDYRDARERLGEERAGQAQYRRLSVGGPLWFLRQSKNTAMYSGAPLSYCQVARPIEFLGRCVKVGKVGRTRRRGRATTWGGFAKA